MQDERPGTGSGKAPKHGWYASPSSPDMLQWWDSAAWADAWWPARQGIQPAPEYLPAATRVDISHGHPVVDIVGEAYRRAEITTVLGRQPAVDEQVERFVAAELVPEPDNPHGDHAVSVRVARQVVGYIPDDLSRTVQPFIARFISAGQVPTVQTRIWAVTRMTARGPELKSAIRVALPDFERDMPLNDPPAAPYTTAPAGRRLKVIGAQEQFEYLADYIPPSGTANLTVTLSHRQSPSRNSVRDAVTVALDGHDVGELSPASARAVFPLVDAQRDRGFATAARAELTGSRVAAELTVSVPKASEVSDEWLDGPAVTSATLPPPTRTPLPPAFVVQETFGAPPPAARRTALWVLLVIAALLLSAIPYVGVIIGLALIVAAFFYLRRLPRKPPATARRPQPPRPPSETRPTGRGDVQEGTR